MRKFKFLQIRSRQIEYFTSSCVNVISPLYDNLTNTKPKQNLVFLSLGRRNVPRTFFVAPRRARAIPRALYYTIVVSRPLNLDPIPYLESVIWTQPRPTATVNVTQGIGLTVGETVRAISVIVSLQHEGKERERKRERERRGRRTDTPPHSGLFPQRRRHVPWC